MPGPPLKFQLTLRGAGGAPSSADFKFPSRCCLCCLWAARTVTWALVFSDFSLLGRQRGSCCASISFLYLKRCQICPKCHKGSCQGTRLRKVLENAAPSWCKREAKAWGTNQLPQMCVLGAKAGDVWTKALDDEVISHQSVSSHFQMCGNVKIKQGEPSKEDYWHYFMHNTSFILYVGGAQLDPPPHTPTPPRTAPGHHWAVVPPKAEAKENYPHCEKEFGGQGGECFAKWSGGKG